MSDALAARAWRATVARAVQAGVGGGPNDRRAVRSAGAVRVGLTLRLAVRQSARTAVQFTLRSRVGQAAAVVARLTGADRRAVAQQGRVASRLSTTLVTAGRGRITRRTFTLRDVPGASATPTAGFTNSPNALGRPNGTTATSASSLTAATDRTLALTWAALADLGGATVTAAQLLLHHSHAVALVGPGTLTVDVAVDGAAVRVLTTSAAVDTLTVPQTVDLLPRLGANRVTSLNSVVVTYRHTAGLSAGNTAAVDAVVRDVTAVRTDLP